MPVNGRVAHWPSLKLTLFSSASVDGTSGGHSAEAITQEAVNISTLATGFALSVESSFTPSGGTYEAVYRGPNEPFGGYIMTGSTYQPSMTLDIILRDYDLYNRYLGSLWREEASDVEIWLNGVLQTSLGPISFDSTGHGPNYVPLIGMPIHLINCGASASRTPPAWTYDPCAPSAPPSYSYSATGTHGARWSFEDSVGDGGYISLPVALLSSEPPSAGGCPFGLSLAGVVSGEGTADLTVNTRSATNIEHTYMGRDYSRTRIVVACVDGNDNVRVVYDNTDYSWCWDPCTASFRQGYADRVRTITTTESQGGTVMAHPNTEKAYQKIGAADFGIILERIHTLPETRALLSRSCTLNNIVSSASSNPVIHPFTNVFLGNVSDGEHPMEDVLGRTIYAPMTASESKSVVTSFTHYGPTGSFCVAPPWAPAGSGLCLEGEAQLNATATFFDPLPATVTDSEAVSLSFPSSVGACSNPQDHLVDLARYTGTVCNPFYAYAIRRANWSVDGSPQPWLDYWAAIGEQWAGDAALPEDEETRRRNTIVSQPLTDYAERNAAWLDALQSGYRWAGIHRFQVLEVAIPATVTMSTSVPGVWSADGCTISLTGSGIECTF